MADTVPEDLVFRGGGGTECERFLIAIHRWAFEREKDEDDRWLARFAATRLEGDAYRVYVKLDNDVRRSWDLLRQALLERYPASEPTIPVPAAAVSDMASIIPDGEAVTGIIQIILEGDTKEQYLCHALEGELHDEFFVGELKDAALAVRLRRITGLQPIRIFDQNAWLGLLWDRPFPGPYEYMRWETFYSRDQEP